MSWALASAAAALVPDVALSTLCALLPAQHHWARLAHWETWLSSYSLGNSNLDVWALSAAHFLLFVVLVAAAVGREAPRGLATRSRRYWRLFLANSLLLGVTEARALC